MYLTIHKSTLENPQMYWRKIPQRSISPVLAKSGRAEQLSEKIHKCHLQSTNVPSKIHKCTGEKFLKGQFHQFSPNRAVPNNFRKKSTNVTCSPQMYPRKSTNVRSKIHKSALKINTLLFLMTFYAFARCGKLFSGSVRWQMARGRFE